MVDREKLRAQYLAEGWGKLALDAGFDPVDTESSARSAFRFADDKIKTIEAERQRLLTATTNAAALIGATYEWLARVEKAGGATSIEGVAACHAMLTSLRKNADRTEKLVMEPLRKALAESA
ncbi:hypothetical protein VQ042_11675 [Aurantimonas sp. A2-1-M11]|uniref:hypothetical protein n=1 Tax=Aurantimonas sp. A2-1-M11 TaxID=3113712 RepID=UPI002F9503C8